MVTMKTLLNEVEKSLSNDEKEFLNTLIDRLETFNNVYLLTNRFIEKIEEYADSYFNSKTGNSVNKYHYYATLGIRFKILKKEVEWSNLDYVEEFKLTVLNLGLEEDYIYDKDAETLIRNNEFYNLLFTIKLIEGVDNE